MKIEGSGIKSVIANSVSEEKASSARQGAQKGDTPASSRVQLSALSARMQEIESRLGSTQVVDSARVSEIKQAITDGQFKVNPEVVADKLIDTVRELIQSNKA